LPSFEASKTRVGYILIYKFKMKNGMKKITFCFLLVLAGHFAMAQQTTPTEYGSGLKVDLSPDGKKYFRLITWHQFWLNTNSINTADKVAVTPMLRRSRFLMYAQLSDRFLILTHFGLNNLTPAGTDPLGHSPQAQLFMHDAWVEFKVCDQLFLGGGLHYWNGISRLNNSSTLNFLALDNPRHAWASLGTTDQFARHLGVYAKGMIGKLDYRFAWNGAGVNSLDVQAGTTPTTTQAAYIGRQTLGVEAANIYAGYVNYQFWDKESNKLPYFVGSYLGGKKVFNLGAGFYSHPKGSILLDENGSAISENVFLWAVDAFMELPMENKLSLTGYLSFQNNNYGSNYRLTGTSQAIFTGNVVYFQGGVLLPSSGKVAWQPYVTLTQKSISALDDGATDFGVGINSLITGHHAKLTLEYHNTGFAGREDESQLILQAVIFL
jgi:hypothetical protein